MASAVAARSMCSRKACGNVSESAAGHDARYLHAICPTAMIFVPSRDGITHNEAEYTAPADLYAGARVLTDVLDRLITSAKTP